MKHQTFQALATKWSRIAKEKPEKGGDIYVTFNGTQAFTNGKQVNLPSFPNGTILTPSQLSIYNGYLDHETAHLRYTEFKQLPKYITKPLHTLWNLFEDIRIENRQIKDFPGSKKYLDHLCHEIDKDNKPKEPIPPMMLIYQECYSNYRKIDTGKIPNKLADDYPVIHQELTYLPNCKDTKDTLELAKRVLKLLENQENQPQQSPDQREGGKTDSQEDNQSQEENQDGNNSNGNGDDGDDPTGRPDFSNNNTGDLSDKNPKEIGSPRELCEEDSRPSNNIPLLDQQAEELDKLLNSLKDIIGNLNQKVSQENQLNQPDTGIFYPPAYPEKDQFWIKPPKNLENYELTRSQVTTEISALKKSISIYLMSRSQRNWLRGLEEGETLDQQRLSRILMPGRPDVFKIKRDRTMINTALELMIDLSSSMPIILTRLAAIICAEALSTIPKLKLSISGFRCESGYGLAPKRQTGRLGAMTIFSFKDFDTPWPLAKGYLGSLIPHGNTPLGDSYAKAFEHILPREEPRKIIWLISDGEPQFNQGDHQHSDFSLMKNIHQKCQTKGIETLGIEIGKENLLKPYVDQSVFIKTHQELPRILLEACKKTVRMTS